MQRLRLKVVSLVTAVLLPLPACNPPEPTAPDARGQPPADDGPKPVASAGPRGTLKGRVTLEGPRPDVDRLNQDLRRVIEENRDREHCLKGTKGETEQQAWRIDGKGGVGNVVVWLKPPEGHFFRMERSDLDPPTRTWREEVVLDTPHCAFVPHMLVLFPSYYEPRSKKQVPTGQVLQVRNSAPIDHNVRWDGLRQTGVGSLFAPKGGYLVPLRASPEPIGFACNVHPWMIAHAWAFDHPFAAVTAEDGTYQIKDVPTGVDLRVMAWHEKAGYLNGKDGDAARLKERENVKDFNLRAE